MIQEADRLFRRYMQALGWLGDPGLFELVRTHIIKVPTENVSALLAGKTTLPGVESYLEGIAQLDLGGDGFTNNGYFAELLRYLDYDVELLAADVDGAPRAHAVIQVLHDERPHLVDVGLGAPFYEPLPLDRLPLRIESGDWVYTLDHHSDPGAHVMTVAFQGAAPTEYVIRPEPRRLADFSDAVAARLDPAGDYLRGLHITRIFASSVATIDGASVAITRHNETQRRPLADLEELGAAGVDDLQLHNLPLGDAIEALRERGVDLFA